MQNLFSYPLKVEDMGSGSKKYQLKASSEQLKYVAEVLKLDNILRFESDIEVSFLRKNHKINIKGSLVADVEETSVISLEKFIKTYTPNFEIVFDTELTEKELKEMEFDFDDDEPDVIKNGQIDLADIAMEQLALVLDDFPRKEGEVFAFESEFDEETTKKTNPFAALANLKK